MSWDVAVAGTVTLDDVTTPAGRRVEQPGGSAVHFALAAARYTTVHLFGAVGAGEGEDVRDLLAAAGVDAAGLVELPGATYRWTARHDFERWVTADERSDEGVYAHWRPQLPAAAAAAPVLFLGSMRPELQLAAAAGSRARLVGVDSMTAHIRAARDGVLAAAERADVLFADRAELAALAGGDPSEWREQARSLLGRGRLRAVAVKAGPEGAALVTRLCVAEVAARPVARVVDPTGAGDALAGGLLGACARDERDDDAYLGAALAEGVRQAAAAVSRFGTGALGRAQPGRDRVGGAAGDPSTSERSMQSRGGRMENLLS